MKPNVNSIFVMFASARLGVTRGLIPASRSLGMRSFMTPRFMSSSGSDETIVSTCRNKIMKALETEECEVIGAYDDPNGSHIAVKVVSPLFAGKRPVQRQQLVYKALWEELQSGSVHAVDSMVCKTPEES